MWVFCGVLNGLSVTTSCGAGGYLLKHFMGFLFKRLSVNMLWVS